MDTFAIEIENLHYKYNEKNDWLFENINLKIKKGKMIAIVGLSGCGKTTLIKVLNGVIPNRYEGVFNGRVLINGNETTKMDVSQIATEIGTIFQEPDTQIVFTNVEDEIAFGPENLCIEKHEILRRTDNITKLLNIENLRKRNPHNLSGGEKQLVVLASVLSLGADILLLDEIMSQVDEKGKKLIKKGIEKLKQDGKTIIMIEHDLENLDLADEVYVLSNKNLEEFKGTII